MISPPLGIKVIHIPTVPSGCCETQFDSTYPIHLNGIIRQDEFVESIENINRSMNFTKEVIVLTIIFVVSVLMGVILLAIGVALTVKLSSSLYLILVGIGGGFLIFAFIFSATIHLFLQNNRSFRIREAIRQESMKYSNRSPIPCSWRLDTTNFYASPYEKQRSSEFIFYLVIDIGLCGPIDDNHFDKN